MIVLFDVLIFFSGSTIVSFLTVLGHDYRNEQVLTFRRSHCDLCKRELSWYEVIPIISYLGKFGKCKCCKYKLPWGYLLSEIAGGSFLAATIYLHKDFFFILPIFIMLILFSVMDIYYGFIYPEFYLLLLPSLLLHLTELHFIEASLVYIILFIPNFFKTSMGLGDMEVLVLLTILFGMNKILYIQLIACTLVLLHYLFRKKRSYKFIPYLSVAVGIIYLIF